MWVGGLRDVGLILGEEGCPCGRKWQPNICAWIIPGESELKGQPMWVAKSGDMTAHTHVAHSVVLASLLKK